LRTAACLAFAALFFVACCLLLNRQAGATLREMFRAVRRCVVQYSAFQQQRDAARVLAAAAHGLSARRIANARRMHPVAREQHAALRRSRAAVGELGEEFVVLLRDNESACEVLKHSIKSEKERHGIAVSQSALVQVMQGQLKKSTLAIHELQEAREANSALINLLALIPYARAAEALHFAHLEAKRLQEIRNRHRVPISSRGDPPPIRVEVEQLRTYGIARLQYIGSLYERLSPSAGTQKSPATPPSLMPSGPDGEGIDGLRLFPGDWGQLRSLLASPGTRASHHTDVKLWCADAEDGHQNQALQSGSCLGGRKDVTASRGRSATEATERKQATM